MFLKGDSMMKKWSMIGIAFLTLVLLTACSKKDTPENRLITYIDLWEEEKWTDMYDAYITSEAQETYGKEHFIERTEKLYTDLGISNVKITLAESKEQKKPSKEEDALLPVTIKMDTSAGPVTFKKDVKLTFAEQDDMKTWFIKWDPSFVLPGLTADAKIRIAAIVSKRGEIIDRNDKGLAINGSGAEIGVVAGKFDADNDANRLAAILGTTAEFIQEQLNQKWVEEGHFLAIKKLPFTQQNKYNEALQIPGVTAMKAEMREYPYAKSLAHLIGYTGPINGEELEKLKDKGYTESDEVGKRGLEQLLEDRLRGEDGIEIYMEKDSEVTTIAEIPAVDGEEIQLTIDAEFQQSVYAEMNEEPGTAAVVDPKTGETLVLASSPAFDPNELALGISSARYAALTEHPDEPMLNRFATTYAPGSSIKPITAAIGLTAGTLDPEKGHTINANKWQKDKSWGKFQVTRVYHTPNPVNLKKALLYSDNIYFAKEALNMKKNELVDGLTAYGFGEDIPFKYGLRTSQISNDGKIGSEGQLVDTSFGQGEMLMNILHLASSYEAIVGDGTMVKPVLFADEKTGEVWKKDLLSKEDAALLREHLRAVVTDGLSDAAAIPEVNISGKTGTAELKTSLDEAGKENGFFVAYPTDDAAYIIAMMIEGVESKGGSGHVAGKVANVMKNR